MTSNAALKTIFNVFRVYICDIIANSIRVTNTKMRGCGLNNRASPFEIKQLVFPASPGRRLHHFQMLIYLAMLLVHLFTL